MTNMVTLNPTRLPLRFHFLLNKNVLEIMVTMRSWNMFIRFLKILGRFN